jgi:DnaJ-like protein
MTIDPAQAYRLLGLAPGASLEDVKTAYRDLAQVWHPDRFPDNARLREKAEVNLRRINEAYTVLRDYRAGAAAAAAVVATAPAAHPAPHVATAGRQAPPLRFDLRHSMFTGVVAMRHSIKVLRPSATYARKPRRRGLPKPWIRLGIAALLLVAFAVAALWYKGYLDF